MKAEVTNQFEAGSFSITTTTALFARKVSGVWRVHLNYHRINVRYLDAVDDQPIRLLSGQGLSIQTGKNLDLVAGVSLILGSIGLVQSLIDTIRKVLEVLADVRSLIPKVLEWLGNELTSIIAGEEPEYQTRLEQAQFVMNLFKDGAYVERRLPRWREKFRDK